MSEATKAMRTSLQGKKNEELAERGQKKRKKGMFIVNTDHWMIRTDQVSSHKDK